MNNIQLNIVANAQFQQVYAEVAKLKEAMLSLQQTSVGGPFTPANVAGIKQAQTAFDNAVLSTRAFNIETVAMSSNIEQFGKKLQSGQLSINQYYKIWRDNAYGVSTELDNLATSQARLNRSIAIADPLKPGYAKLVTDINGVVTAQEKSLFYQQALNTALNQGATKLIDFGKNMQWAGRQMTVGLTVPLALFASQVTQTYLSFDQQMTDMLKVYGSKAVVQSQQALDTIKTQVTSLAENLAHTIGVTMTDTVTIAKTFSSIGLEGQNLVNATQATATLMKLGGLAATDSANAMVTLQNVFKLSSDQMAGAVDFLNAAKHSTSTTMQDLIDAIPRVGPILQQMGGTYKDFTTLIVALKENGVPAAQGANAIKSMFASLDNPTTKAITMFNNLGISLKGIINKDQGNPLQMVLDLQKALDQLPSQARQQAIEQLFGKFQFARVEALLNSLGKAGSQNAKVLELYNQSNDQLAAVAKQEIDISSNKTPAAQYQKMKASLQADLIPLGQTFLQVMTKLGNIIDGIVKGFNGLGAAGKILMGALIFVGVTGPLLMLTGLFSNFVGQMLKGANYIRMFKQGMEDASPSQNKFLAGIRNLTNFYQDLDKSTIAARNQIELMPEAITSNAQAFDILRKSISDLTDQFVALTQAQKEAMGGFLVSDTLETALTTAAETVQMNLPGFAFGGVVPGTGNKDTYAAMLTPGETVITKDKSKKYSNVLSQIMNDNFPGYNSGTDKGEPASQFAHVGEMQVMKLSDFENYVKTAGINLSQGVLNWLSDLKKISSDIELRIGSGFGFSQAGNLNTAMRNGGTVPVSSFLSDFESKGVDKWKQSLSYAGVTMDEVASDLRNYDKALPAAVRAWQELNGSVEISSAQFASIEKIVRENVLAPTSKLRTAIESAEQGVFDVRANVSKEYATSHGMSIVPSERGSSKKIKGTMLRVGGNRKTGKSIFGGLTGSVLELPQGMDEAIPSVESHAEKIINAALNSMQSTGEIQSPAKKFVKQVGLPIGQGVAVGMETAISEVKEAGQKLRTAVQEELDFAGNGITTDFSSMWTPAKEASVEAGSEMGENIIGSIEKEVGSSVSGNRISSAFSKISGKFSNMGMMGRMGAGAGLMMAGSTMGSMIGGTAGNAMSNVSNFASMGMMFGGYGAAAGAAIGGIKSIFDYLNKEAAQTAQNWKDVTTTSTSDLQIFKSTALNTSIQTHNLSVNTSSSAAAAKDAAQAMAGLTTQFGILAPTVQSMINSIKNLPKGDPLGDMVKQMSDPNYKLSSVVGNIQKSVTSAISTGGLDPKQAKQYVYSLFAASGRTADFATGWKEISKNIGYNAKTGTADVSAATSTNINKLMSQDKNFTQTEAVRGEGLINRQYKDLAGGAKALADQMKNLYAITSNGSLTFSQYQDRLKGVKSSGQDTGTALVALEQAILGTGSTDDIERLHQAEGYIKDMGPNAKLSASEIMKMNAVLQVMTPDQLKKWADANGKALGVSSASKMASIIDAYAKSSDFKAAVAEANKAMQDVLGGGSGGGGSAGGAGGGSTTTTVYDTAIKQTTALQKLVQANVDAQKKYNDQLKLTQDYYTKQMDYFSQMKDALTSGNYLAAAQAQQSGLSNQADYLSQMSESKQSDQLSSIQNFLDLLNSAKQGNEKLSSFLSENKIKSLTAGINAAGGYAATNQAAYSKQTNTWISKASALSQAASKAASGGAFSTVNVNIDATGSILDQNTIDSLASSTASVVQAQLAKQNTKSNTSNNVTGSTFKPPKPPVTKKGK